MIGWSIRDLPAVFAHMEVLSSVCNEVTVYPKKYAHSFCFAVLCCGYTLTDFPISIRLTSLALWQSNDCPSASKATLMNMDKYFMWIHYERFHNHNKAKHNKTVCIFLGIYCYVCSPISSVYQPKAATLSTGWFMTSKSFLHYWPFVRGIHLVDSPHKGPVMQKAFLCNGVIVWVSCSTCRALMFCLLSTWSICWTNSQVASDLRCHHAHSNAVYGHFCHVGLSLCTPLGVHNWEQKSGGWHLG